MQNNTRVLAYNLAKEIEPEELKNISGGESSLLCMKPSGKLTGANHEWDVSTDIVVDF